MSILNLSRIRFCHVLLLVLTLLSLPSLSLAEVLRYKDSDGKTHYVSSEAKIPSEFRYQLKRQSKLPKIGKYKPGMYDRFGNLKSKKRKAPVAKVAKSARPAVTPQPLKHVVRTKPVQNKPVQSKVVQPKPKTNVASSRTPVEIYVSSECAHCGDLESYLRSQNIRFKKFNIENSEKLKNQFTSIFGTGSVVPGIKYKDEYFTGFNKARLNQVLDLS